VTDISRAQPSGEDALVNGITGTPGSPDWVDLVAIEADLTLRPRSPEDRGANVISGDVEEWTLPWRGTPLPGRGIVDLIDCDRLGPGEAGRIRLHPLAPYLWRYVNIGPSLALWSHDVDDHPAGVATVTRLVREPAVVLAT
jgi:hypothetical protein